MEKIDEMDALDDATIDLFQSVHDLTLGKVDRVAVMIEEVIPSHIEACKAQIEKLEALRAKLESLSIDALKLACGDKVQREGDETPDQAIMRLKPEDRALNGTIYSMSLRQTPGRIVVDDVLSIPPFYRNVHYTIRLKIDSANQEAIKHWDDWAAAQTKGGDGSSVYVKKEEEPDKTALKSLMTEGVYLHGVRVEKELKLSIGRAKPAKKAKSKGLQSEQ